MSGAKLWVEELQQQGKGLLHNRQLVWERLQLKDLMVKGTKHDQTYHTMGSKKDSKATKTIISEAKYCKNKKQTMEVKSATAKGHYT